MTAVGQLPTQADLCALVSEVWASFLDGKIRPVEDVTAMAEGVPLPQLAEVMSVVSMTGSWNGHLLLAVSSAGAVMAARAMFGVEQDVTPEELADAIGELANIVAGNIKSVLPEPSVLSLPYVVVGPKSFSLPSTRLRCGAAMTWNDEYPVAVSLWEAHPVEEGAPHAFDHR